MYKKIIPTELLNIEIVSIPKKLKNITDLYRACRYEEAEALMNKISDYPHQKADIKAQLAFFQWDFDNSVKYILEFYPYLREWYSGNKYEETKKMLVFFTAECFRNGKK